MSNYLNVRRKELNYEKIYLYLTLSLAFVMPLSRAAISFFILALVFFWFLEGDFKRKFEQIKSSKILFYIGIFYFIVLFSAILSSNIETALKFIRLYAYWIVIFVIATSLKREYINTIITAFLLGMFVSEVIAYGVFFNIWKFGIATIQNPSPFMIHIDYSVFLAFTSLILFNRIISKNYSLKEKIFLLLFFCSTTGNLFLSTGRTGQVAFIFGIIVMFFLCYKFHIKTFIYSFLSLLIIFTLAFSFSKSFKKRVFQANSDIVKIASGDLNSSWGIRVAYWMVSYEILKENIIFGVGTGDYKEAITKTLEKKEFSKFPKKMKEFMIRQHTHNQFLMVIIQMGLVGIFMVILIFYQLLKVSLGLNNRNMFVLFLVIYFISCMADPLWYKQFTLVLWLLIVGLISII